MTTEPLAAEEAQEPEDLRDPGLARSAGVLAAGSVAGRVLGLVREIVIAAFFGATGAVSAFRIAAQIPNLVYDLLIGGMLSAALVPVLSAKATDRREFTRLAGALLGVFGLVLAAITLVLFAAAPAVANLLAAGFRASDPPLFALTAQLIRLMTPAIWFISMAGLLMGVLYALRRFSMPALAAALFNLGIVLCTPLLAARLGIFAAAVGVLVGSLIQGGVMAWDVRRARISLRPRLEWNHPALRQILRLYLPIAVGLIVMIFQVALDRRLASTTGVSSIAWMATATTLQQMPLGLISVAISLASLPTLSRDFAARDESQFRRTLGRGLRYVLILIVPAAIGLALLAVPITRVLFEHGAFTTADTLAVTAALWIYLVGMLFAAADYPLNYAFYARNNTLLPAIVGIASVGVYMIVAFTLLEPLGFLGLVWADTAKQAAHALVMFALLLSALGLPRRQNWLTVIKVLGAGAAMALVLFGLDLVARRFSGYGEGAFLFDVALIVVAGASSLAVYVAALKALRVREADEVWQRLAGTRIMGRLNRSQRAA